MKIKGTKISIIGAGYVGSTTAFTLMASGLASEIVIVDIDKKRLKEKQWIYHMVYPL